MAFNVNDYIKPVAKPFTNRIIDPVVSSASTGYNTGTKSIAQSTASNMLTTAGASYKSVVTTATSTTDNAVSEVADAFYAVAGANVQRATRQSLVDSRFGRMSATDFLNASDPLTRIGAARKNNTIEIISVI